MIKNSVMKLLMYAAILIFSLASVSSAQEEKPENAEISAEIIKKGVSVYGTSLKRILEKTEKELERVNKKLEEQENEKLAQEYFEEGNAVYEKGNPEEAGKQWKKAFRLTKDRALKKKIRQALRKK